MKMKSFLAAHALLIAIAIASGCAGAGGGYHVSSNRIGALYAAKPAPCSVTFQNLNFQEASSKYENLGLISVTGASSSEFTDGMKKDVEREACKMGADAVSLNVSGSNVFQFLVWRNR